MYSIHHRFSFKAIAIISCLILSVPVYAGGLFFDREKFKNDTRINLDISDKDTAPLPKIGIDEKITIRDEMEKRFSISKEENKDSIAVINKESKASRFRLTISQINGNIQANDKLFSSNDDKLVSRIVETMPSLFYGDSKVRSLETMGRLVEPQINIYFEF